MEATHAWSVGLSTVIVPTAVGTSVAAIETFSFDGSPRHSNARVATLWAAEGSTPETPPEPREPTRTVLVPSLAIR
jgi:hypothetical protein